METIEIKWDLLGAKLARLNDDDQAKFFTGFAKELKSWDTHYAREAQMLHINSNLCIDVKKTLEDYLPALWYEEKN